LLSLHALPVTGVCTQPVEGLQLSSVHGLLSSQDLLASEQLPPEQTPGGTWHMSVGSQALPSSF
jgi:hypothetical protein